MANPWVPSRTTLVEHDDSFFTSKLDEPQECIMEKQLRLFAKSGALERRLHIGDNASSNPHF